MTENPETQIARLTAERDKAVAGLKEALEALREAREAPIRMPIAPPQDPIRPAPWYSARWLLTLLCGIVFGVVAIRGLLEPQAIASILTGVFAFYFMRPDRGQKGGV